MLPVRSEQDEEGGAGTGGDEKADQAGTEAPPGLAAHEPSTGESSTPVAELFPPGPLAAVRVIPSRVLIECRATKRVRAQGTDAEDRVIPTGVEFFWELSGPVGTLTDVDLPPNRWS